ncbi:uncharacterized protein TNCV_4821361 [Trichonephila clavipes]|nr:uncharacterized protein TNCV_4821361 [Trichonephila clavipes]
MDLCGILNASSVASWGNAENGKSFSGGVALLDNSLIFWKCRKEKSVSLSIREAELFSISEACKDIIWTVNLLTELKCEHFINNAVTLNSDSQAAIQRIKVFGLGSLIGVGLGAATLFSLEQPCMDQINWVQPLLLAAFTLLQTHVLCIDSQRSVGYLGWCRHPVLMHLFAANLAIWLRMLIWDGAEIWLRHAHEFIPNPTAHSLDKEGRHAVHEKIVKRGKPFANGEFARECLQNAFNVPSQAEVKLSISLSDVEVIEYLKLPFFLLTRLICTQTKPKLPSETLPALEVVDDTPRNVPRIAFNAPPFWKTDIQRLPVRMQQILAVNVTELLSEIADVSEYAGKVEECLSSSILDALQETADLRRQEADLCTGKKVACTVDVELKEVS